MMLLFAFSGVKAGVVKVAVASNFSKPLHLIAKKFKSQTGHELLISSASTGKLYAQIKRGAPYDIFMSADTKTTDRLIAEGLANNDSQYTYALGQLVLLSNHNDEVDCKDILKGKGLRYLSIANPNTAPYGLAAQQVLVHLGLWETLESKLVMGENIAQAMQFVVSQNADAGLVALSLVKSYGLRSNQCMWPIPLTMYQEVKQSMVIVKGRQVNHAIADFYAFMAKDSTKKMISDLGYSENP